MDEHYFKVHMCIQYNEHRVRVISHNFEWMVQNVIRIDLF